MTKHDLYKSIDALCYEIGLQKNISNYPMDAKKLVKIFCKKPEIIDDFDFKDFRICGFTIRKPKTTTIFLNREHDEYMQNFNCMHELIHYFYHDDESYSSHISMDTSLIHQKGYVEWQANEGAAQFLMPFQIFIPTYIEYDRRYSGNHWNNDLIKSLADKFYVSHKVILLRIKNLTYEIYQYKNGVPIDSIKMYSNRQLTSRGLDKVTPNSFFCTQCYSRVFDSDNYCVICGRILNVEKNMRNTMYPNKYMGVGYVAYSGIELDDDSKAQICPRCENDEINDGEFCKICGIHIVNRCSNFSDYDSCGALADGNARYCHICGSSTTFCNNGLLEPWETAKKNVEEKHKY